MSDIQRSDPTARRQAVTLVAIGAVVGVLLLLGFERLQGPLRDWILSEPERSAQRAGLVSLVMAAVLGGPLLCFAVYFWRLGVKVVRAQQYPPPMHRVVRDTPILRGRAALIRGRLLGGLAVGLVILAALLSLLPWWLAMLFRTPHAA